MKLQLQIEQQQATIASLNSDMAALKDEYHRQVLQEKEDNKKIVDDVRSEEQKRMNELAVLRVEEKEKMLIE